MKHKLSVTARYDALRITIHKKRIDLFDKINDLFDHYELLDTNAKNYLRYNFISVILDEYCSLLSRCHWEAYHLQLKPDADINDIRRAAEFLYDGRDDILLLVQTMLDHLREKTLELLSKQEPLGHEFQQILHDNLKDLYEN